MSLSGGNFFAFAALQLPSTMLDIRLLREDTEAMKQKLKVHPEMLASLTEGGSYPLPNKYNARYLTVDMQNSNTPLVSNKVKWPQSLAKGGKEQFWSLRAVTNNKYKASNTLLLAYTVFT